MDDIWASRVHSSNHFSAHPSSGNQVVLDNTEVKDDARTYFTCPFCYMDIDLSLLCDHFQEEHCFDVKNAVCPVCALNLGKDVAGHFKMHHSNSIKKRSHKSGFWNFYAGRNMHGGLSSKNGLDNANGSAPDPLLSPFLCTAPYSENKENQSQNSFSVEDVSFTAESESCKPMLNEIELKKEDSEQSEEMKQRAEFCQHLIYSTML